MYVGRIERLLAYYSPLPMCIVNAQGKVTRASKKITEVFKYDGIIDYDIFALTGIKMPEFVEAAKSEEPLYIQRNDKTFRIGCAFLGGGEEDDEVREDASIILHFTDITAYEELKERYKDDRVYMMLVNVDNFDEIISGSSDDSDSNVRVNIDKLIRSWAAGMEAMIVRYRENMYELAITHRNYEALVEDKFSILDSARQIESPTDFPVTLSIGLGVGKDSLVKLDDYAQEALDMALGRGGDQAVIKEGRSFEYYGGRTQSVEKSNKGKSRIIGHALATLMEQSSRIFIMGHKNPDMDSFGAAIGVSRLAKSVNKDAFILLGEYNETMIDMVADARKTDDYQFVTAERAMEMVEDNSLVVVVDTHRRMLVESAELIDKVERLAIIDHHRKAEDAFANPSLSYLESYASSASELVTEMLQYRLDKKSLSRFEADALMAGIMLDTNRFAVKAGVRTFEAASWLRRSGADLSRVRRYFQESPDSFINRANGIVNARILEGGIAMSICRGQSINTQIVNSQVADELLTIKGTVASFVAGRDAEGKTVVSARSLGNMNVQAIMENFGGGGHMNTAGTKTDLPPEEILAQIEEYIKTTETTQ
ncbi:MAG: DHH family phosphoesterase [Clostridia bacterium]|nr:DHH family phosphoesterase [Clostridia bacterium]